MSIHSMASPLHIYSKTFEGEGQGTTKIARKRTKSERLRLFVLFLAILVHVYSTVMIRYLFISGDPPWLSVYDAWLPSMSS